VAGQPRFLDGIFAPNEVKSQSARDLLVTCAMRIALLGCALGLCLAACASPYRPGSFASSDQAFAGERATVGCLDVAIERRADAKAGPVLAYQFANRCDRMTVIDLAAVAVVARHVDGSEAAMRPYDPRGEIRPVSLDGRKIGGEALAYWARGTVAQVCVDLATLAGSGPPQWLCFASETSGALPVEEMPGQAPPVEDVPAEASEPEASDAPDAKTVAGSAP
jgi:hypothetical protein